MSDEEKRNEEVRKEVETAKRIAEEGTEARDKIKCRIKREEEQFYSLLYVTSLSRKMNGPRRNPVFRFTSSP